MDTPSTLYASVQPFVKKEIDDANNSTVVGNQNQQGAFNLSHINDHAHTGLDSAQIDPKNLLGFPIVTSVPTTSVQSGSIYIYTDSISAPTVAHLYVRIGKTWKIIT